MWIWLLGILLHSAIVPLTLYLIMYLTLGQMHKEKCENKGYKPSDDLKCLPATQAAVSAWWMSELALQKWARQGSRGLDWRTWHLVSRLPENLHIYWFLFCVFHLFYSSLFLGVETMASSSLCPLQLLAVSGLNLEFSLYSYFSWNYLWKTPVSASVR